MSDIPINPVTRRVQFTGNTGTGPFAFTFNIYAASDIAVYKNSTLLTLTTHYTVSIASNGTGSISLTGSGSGSALISSDVLTIVGARALSRTTDFVTAGDLRAVSLNEELDSSVIMSQQLDEKSDRALKFDQFDVYGSATLPVKAARLGTVLGFNATTGNPEAGPTIADVSALSAITADIATLADIQDGTVATSAITNVNTVRANVTTVAGISGNVTTVAGISANINTVVTNITDIQNAEENAAAAIVAKDAAVVAQGAAETAQTAAEAALDSFTDTYLGAFSSDPSADNDGNALTAGDLYFNTTSNIMKVYSGSVWQAVALSAADFLTTANNLSDLANAGTARSNLGLGTAATTAATAYVAKTSATGSGGLPAGTTAQRDGSPAAGYMRYNSTTSSFEGYSGSAWGAIPTDTTGGLAYLGATVGTSSQVLTSDGSGAPAWADAAGGGIDWQSSIVTGSTLTAVAGRGYWVDTTLNACTVTLPGSASVGDTLVFVDYARKWATNNLTINQNSLKFQGFTSPAPVYDTAGQSVSIVYSGAAKGWTPTVDDSVTNEVPQTTTLAFVVVGGGGGGGSYRAGGGGGGGFRTGNSSALAAGTTVTLTVGAGGATSTTVGAVGSVSSIAATGTTTITSAGGGGGGNPAAVPSAGGSGGGAAKDGTGAAGNTPSTSPSQGSNGGNGTAGTGKYGAGGGGGASAVGAVGTDSTGGNGGAGTASSITGSAVTRAGGGGGGAIFSAPESSGGAGGGGDSPSNSNGDAGTANTGGGGGGANSTDDSTKNSGGAGGTGVVIISMLDAVYSGTTTGSPTVATGVSGQTVLTFTGTGTYTCIS